MNRPIEFLPSFCIPRAERIRVILPRHLRGGPLLLHRGLRLDVARGRPRLLARRRRRRRRRRGRLEEARGRPGKGAKLLAR